VQQVALLGRLGYIDAQTWLLEGYADHVGKGANYNLRNALIALQRGSPEMAPESGVYNRHQLTVEFLLKNSAFEALLAAPPNLDDVLTSALLDPSSR
jgi:hypothetical protein